MNKVVLLVVCMILQLYGLSLHADRQTELTAVEMHGLLRVQGNTIVDKHGQPVSLAGPSLFWGNKGWNEHSRYYSDSYYNPAVVKTVQEQWNATIIRIAMGVEEDGGYLSDPDGRMKKICAVADAAIEQGMYFIVDWHSSRADQYTAQAVAFFKEIAKKYGQTPNLIYEIYNEPRPEKDWSRTVKPYAEKVIAAIREIDPDNLVIVGTQNWSQRVDKAADDPLTGFSNIAYTLHFYAGTHKQSLRDRAAYALEKGIALMVTEWGTVNANGDGAVDIEETRRWMEFVREHHLSHCNWSLHSKGEGASILKRHAGPEAQWSDEDYSESGALVVKIIRAWHAYDYAGAAH